MEIDVDRWRALLAALANANDTSPAFGALQRAHGALSQRRADLEKFAKRGAAGQPTTRNPDLAASFQRDVQELEARVAEAEREAARIEALQKQAGARRSALQQLVDGVRSWAQSQRPPITLPGDSSIDVPGFAPTTVHVPPTAATSRAWP